MRKQNMEIEDFINKVSPYFSIQNIEIDGALIQSEQGLFGSEIQKMKDLLNIVVYILLYENKTTSTEDSFLIGFNVGFLYLNSHEMNNAEINEVIQIINNYNNILV
jgi:hypothetical protein